jgi:hypothetical protein
MFKTPTSEEELIEIVSTVESPKQLIVHGCPPNLKTPGGKEEICLDFGFKR